MYKLTIEQDLFIGRELKLPYDIDNSDFGIYWKVRAVIKSEALNDWGMAVDFSHIQKLIKKHDGCFFQYVHMTPETAEFRIYPGNRIQCPFPPTMEKFAEFLWEELSLYLKQSPHYKDILTLKVDSIEIQGGGGSVQYRPT